MEISSFTGIPGLGTEYSSLFHQYEMNPLDDSLDGLNFQSFSSESTKKESSSNIEASHISIERPGKQLKTNSWNSSTTEHSTPKKSPSSTSQSQIISFENSASFPAIPQSSFPSLGSYDPQETMKRATRSPLQAQDHIIAERKRREKISQCFVALSVLLPGLKKMDKTSVLEDAIKYLKKLEERVKTLEEKAAKRTMESVIIVKNSYNNYSDNGTSSADDNFDTTSNKLSDLPQVRVRISGRDVLIRIHCENYKGCIATILKEIENIHLSVVNSNVLPFGISTLDITVVAQTMDIEFAITVKDLVKNLRLALLKLKFM
ncbi:hypothetical protein EZV62_014582 [Acer yangbiense]|uniref:BHLH domain-containing protein n=1 Tax=Acer yangbiense TaxID=1000413 RepID=A0A5C7HTE4_9ROSI|nr:hypothetical protein EZV62_014582 [Acer yangbiense]